MKYAGLFILAFLLIILPTAAQDALPLTETFVSQAIDATFDYPAGWIVRDYETAYAISNSETAIEIGAELTPGDMKATILIAPLTRFKGLDADSSLSDIIPLFQELNRVDTCQPFSDITEVEREDTTILIAWQTCDTGDSIYLFKRLEDDFFALVVGTTHVGEMDALEPIMLDVLVSAKHSTLDVQTTAAVTLDTTKLTQTFTSEDGTVTVRYPDNWSAAESEDHYFVLAQGADSLFSDVDAEETLPIMFMVVSAADLPSMYSTSAVEFALYLTQDPYDGYTSSTPTQFTINGRSASRADLYTEDEQVLLYTIALNADNTAYAVVNAIGSVEEIAEIEWLLYAIGSTIAKLDETTSINTATSPLVLSETFTSDDGMFHFDYPAGWMTEHDAELNLTMLANDAETVENTALLRAFFSPETVDDPTQTTPEQQLIKVLANLEKFDIEALTDVKKSGAENIIRFTVGDREAASFTIDDFGNGKGLTTLEVDLGDGVFLGISASHIANQYKRIEPDLLKIIASIRYGDDEVEDITPRELDASFAADETIPFTFDYPAAWNVERIDDMGAVLLLQSPETEEMVFIVDTIPDMTLSQAIDMISEAALEQNMIPTHIVWFTVDGRDAVQVNTADPDISFEYAEIVLDLGNGNLARIIVPAVFDDFIDIEPTLLAILASVQPTE